MLAAINTPLDSSNRTLMLYRSSTILQVAIVRTVDGVGGVPTYQSTPIYRGTKEKQGHHVTKMVKKFATKNALTKYTVNITDLKCLGFTMNAEVYRPDLNNFIH
ncbi:hypothetical protein AHF37_00531 [Paragonimus kellicotti]|nr:hypothetical protein AHF37_00531 [Paragonimus kellicotti]